MRKDMAKVICERPRRKNKGKLAAIRRHRHEARIDPENAPAIGSMKLLHSVYVAPGGLKEHGEHLRPLARWLHSAVGRKWDDVHSEICRRLDCRSTVQRHVLFHVRGYVHRHAVVMIDGVPQRHVGHGVPPSELWDGELYVDPHTGVLAEHTSNRRLK